MPKGDVVMQKHSFAILAGAGLAVEIPTSGRFFTRAIWKRRIKNSSEFFYNHRAFGKRTRLQVRIDVLPLDVDVMIFGESGFPVVKPVWRQRGAYENPSAKSSWQR